MRRPTYLILGSTGVIGRALCERLSRRGASLVLGGRDPEKLNELAAATGGKACPGDARDAASVELAVAQAVERYGRLDGAVNLVNPIGYIGSEPVHSVDESESVAVNLSPAFHLVQCAAKVLRREGGSIVLISPSTTTAGRVSQEAIAAAEAGVNWLARSATANFASQNVRVNCVAPGLFRTPLTNRLTEAPNSLANSEALNTLGFSSAPEDVAAAIAWLLNPANSQVSGQVVTVDGGLALLHGGARA